MKWIFDKRLTKAPLIRFERLPRAIITGKRIYGRSRLANCWMLHFGYFTVTIRAPWLIDSARALHPELFGLDRAGRPSSEYAGTLCGCSLDENFCQWPGCQS